MVVLSLVFLAIPGVVFLIFYFTNDEGPANQVDFCTLYMTEAACLGQELPSSWYHWASARKMGPGMTQDGWQCEWLHHVAMVTPSCVRANCNAHGRLDSRKLAIVAEFIGLINVVYSIYFIIWTNAILDQ